MSGDIGGKFNRHTEVEGVRKHAGDFPENERDAHGRGNGRASDGADVRERLHAQGAADDLEGFLKIAHARKLTYVGPKSPEIKQIHAIAQNKKGSAIKHFLSEGIWLNQLVLRHQLAVTALFVCAEEIRTPEAYELLEELAHRADRIHLISKKVLDSVAESGNSAGIITMTEIPRRTFADIPLADSALVLVLDGLEIPGNVGTLVRSADGVDASGVLVTNKKTRLSHPKYIRSSQGSCFKMPVVEAEAGEAIAWLRSNGFRILLADTDAIRYYYEEDYSGRVAVVLGSERYGISAPYYEAGGSTVGIPMFGDCDSLNVGIAGTVILYEASLKQKGRLRR